MSEKRFRVCCDDDLGDMWVVDIDTDEEYWTAPSLVDLLNSLAEENVRLREKLREDIAFRDKHISYFQNLIGDIEIEFKLKDNLSKEKWEEIHEKNYQNFRFGRGDND